MSTETSNSTETSTKASLTETPAQTIGPFYGFALPFEKGGELVPPGSPDSVTLHGTVLDGHGDPIPDALLEIWQADAKGNIVAETGSLVRDGRTFTGWGRVAVGNTGKYVFTTVNPGPTEPGKAPFIAVTVFARGLLNRLFTRVYLPEDTDALANDPVLSALEPARRKTLVAERLADGSLHWDIRLQGEDETVFLDFHGQA